MLYRKITSYIEDYLKSDNDKILILEGAVYINPDNVAQERFGNWNSDWALMIVSGKREL